MKFSIVLYVYNLINTIKKILSKVIKVNLNHKIYKEIIINHNNSNDVTKTILKNYEKYDYVKVCNNNFSIFFKMNNLIN